MLVPTNVSRKPRMVFIRTKQPNCVVTRMSITRESQFMKATKTHRVTLIVCISVLFAFLSSSALAEDVIVSPGDTLRVYIPGAQQPEQTYTVNISGDIDLGVYGKLKIGGKTLRRSEEMLKLHLSKYLKSAEGISLYIKEQGRIVLITGCVEKPGVIGIEPTDDAWQAIHRAGGLSSCADVTRTKYYRNGLELDVDLASYLTGDSKEPLPILMTGDTIFVPSGPGLTNSTDPAAAFLSLEALRRKVFVIGAVTVPGIYNLTAGLDLLTLLSAAKGPATAADLSHTKVVTKDRTVTVDLQKAFSDKKENRYMLPAEGGVIVFVPSLQENVDSRLGAHINFVGSFSRPGRIPVSGPISLIDAIGLAGGFSENAKTRKLRVIEEGPGYTLASRYNLKRYLKKGGAMGRVIVKPGSTVALGRINLEPVNLAVSAITAISMVSSTFLLWVNYADALQ